MNSRDLIYFLDWPFVISIKRCLVLLRNCFRCLISFQHIDKFILVQLNKTKLRCCFLISIYDFVKYRNMTLNIKIGFISWKSIKSSVKVRSINNQKCEMWANSSLSLRCKSCQLQKKVCNLNFWKYPQVVWSCVQYRP